jgi:hypothetical protein
MPGKTIIRIDDLLSRINSHPEYSEKVRAQFTRQRGREADKHSLGIELLAEKTSEVLSNPGRPKILENLRTAWQHLEKYGLRLSTLTELGYFIEPEKNPTRNVRSTSLWLAYPPPEPGMLLYEVKELADSLTDTDLHPVLRAVEAHLELVRIHPYVDGNGRAARLLQNFCLQQANYPPAIIPAAERELYMGLLQGTLKKRYSYESSITNPSIEESLFHEFIASKVLVSAEDLEQELQKRRYYELDLKNVDGPALVHSFSRDLRCYAKADGRAVSVLKKNNKKSKRGQYFLTVVGDISQNELTDLIDRKLKPKGIKYSVSNIN